ncbi:MAG TPA: hypothetical protein VHO48_09910 [Anaerolineaceae bacterium]|nr:hypothetical protein [Anaerolineaceae bacterium]
MNNNNYGSKTLVNRKKLIIGGAALVVLLAVILIWVNSTKTAQTIPLSQVASGIVEGQVTRIEDTLNTGELTIHYANGKVEKGLRDTNASHR